MQEQNKKMNKKKLLIIGGVVLLIVAIIVTILVIVLGGKDEPAAPIVDNPNEVIEEQKPKSFEEVENALKENNYLVLYKADNMENAYDKDKKCYYFDGEESECYRERESKISDSVTFYIHNRRRDKVIKIYYDNDKAQTYAYEVEKSNNKYYYDARLDKNIYTVNAFTSNSEQCTYTSKDGKVSNNTCNNTMTENVELMIAEYQNILKDLGVTEKDLFNFVEEYFDKYVKAHIAELNETGGTLSYEETEAKIKESGYEIEVVTDLDEPTVRFKKDDTVLEFFKMEGELGGILSNSIFNRVDLLIYPSKGYRVGSDKTSQKCNYITNSENEALIKTVMDGFECSDEEKSDSEMLDLKYKFVLEDDFELSEEEFFQFVNEFLTKNFE